MSKEFYIKKTVSEDGMPEENGRYSTDLGYIEVFYGKWCADEEPKWWLEKIEEAELIEQIIPEPFQNETFIEQEVSYQHHGVVRGAIANYKHWLKQRTLDKKV